VIARERRRAKNGLGAASQEKNLRGLRVRGGSLNVVAHWQVLDFNAYTFLSD
jgi:hypothetical protein